MHFLQTDFLSENQIYLRILEKHKAFLFNNLIDLLTRIFLWKPRGHEGHFKSIRKRVESVK